MSGLRIVVDACCLANERGYGRFARELLQAMMPLASQDEIVLLADERAAECIRALPELAQATLVVVSQSASPTIAASADGSRSPADMLRFTRATMRAHGDVFFSPSVYTYYPLPWRLPAVITVHDAIASRFPELTMPSRRARAFWQLKTKLALAQATFVLTVSEFAAREIVDVYGLDAASVRVATEAPSAVYAPSESPEDIRRVASACGVPAGARWFAYVGGFNPHKRVDVLLKALAAMTPRDDAPHFVLVGTLSNDVFHGEAAVLRALITELGLEHRVHWPGFVADEGLRHLLSGAIALVLPSENEGFGLPAVEAAACGTPVIATTASPLPQLLDGGGFFIDPGHVAPVRDAMQTLADDDALRARLGAHARERALALSWTRAAEATMRALYEAVGRPWHANVRRQAAP